MNIRNLYCMILFITLFKSSGCIKSAGTINSSINCPFVENNNDDGLIDDQENAIMDYCFDNLITSASELYFNALGEWRLIGHGEGWIISKSQPCSTIQITENALILEFTNSYLDTMTIHNWEIMENSNRAYLKITPPLIAGIYPSIVCENYMFGNATFVDGNMYLYEKVR